VKYEWDKHKAATNLGKHGVSFAEAATVFDDRYFLVFADDEHSFDEQRYLIIGESSAGRVLMVSYTERGDVVRLISAREAGRQAKRQYEEEKYSEGG
jgi:uncharacterized protein